MKVFRGFNHPDRAAQCALTIGNFDGVHRGHQAMLALLKNEAAHRGVPSCVMTFEPHPRDFFAKVHNKPELAPARIATLRDKLFELERCGIDQVVVLPFDERLASQAPEDFMASVLVKGLGVKYLLVGDDFRFGAKRAGDYAMLDAAGQRLGFDVARMNSYEVRGLRVSSSAVRDALKGGFADSLILQLHGARMTEGDLAPRGRAAIQLKDMNNIMQEADKLALTLPMSADIQARFATLCNEMDGADLDHAALYLELLKRNQAS